jgi:Leucine-rich repeat (LRR) protein
MNFVSFQIKSHNSFSVKIMDNKVSYQRAVTPTLENSGSGNGGGVMRGKVLSYSSNPAAATSQQNRFRNLQISAQSNSFRTASMSPRVNPNSDMAISGRTANTNPGMNSGGGGIGIATYGKGMLSGSGGGTSSKSNPSNNDNASTILDQYVLPRFDLVPIQDDIPVDGIIFSRIRGNPDSLVIFRTPEERLRNPERLNLDRRNLEFCPILEQEHRLRLLNYQNNHIKFITNLENLPNLIFLDLYNNQIVSLDGPLSSMKGLRVLMAGKNKITQISNLENLKKLDVLDLHSNEIKQIEGLEQLSDLRVLNLAGNRISQVNNLSSLVSLTELNLRRNHISTIEGLEKLPSLQRVFLSHNAIEYLYNINCIFQITYLIELSMDGNPVTEHDPVKYRNQVISHIPSLKHLDLKRITDEERSLGIKSLNNQQVVPQLSLFKDENAGTSNLNNVGGSSQIDQNNNNNTSMMISSSSVGNLKSSNDNLDSSLNGKVNF